MKGLFIFRRDLRWQDNIGLYEACDTCEKIICLFILTPTQIKKSINKYFSYNAFAFMLESLIELKNDINLIIEYGEPEIIIKKIVKEYDIDQIFMNKDYTPYAIERDKKIISALPDTKINLYCDIVINDPSQIKPYKVYTPYYNFVKNIKIHDEVKPDIKKIINVKYKSINIKKLLTNIMLHTSKYRQNGGRQNGEKLLKELPIAQKKYLDQRNNLTHETSRLSPHIKFGVIGIREVYRSFNNEGFRKELYWRDFYIQISYHFPNVIIDKDQIPLKSGKYLIDKNFKQQKIQWEYSEKLYNAWCKGKTGIPIVDAAMRQLINSGYMHNRCRMIVASVFTKLFHLDWRLGEQYFAKYLTDYDPSSNNGGWQWASGTGADSQPYFRIFNPYIQAKKYDPECLYIKKWCPELNDMEPKEIFKLKSNIFEYEAARKKSIEFFKNAE
jgi:deoxyribodipyrimidine photo-lyase